MAIKKTAEKAKTENKKATIPVDQIKVTRAHQFDNSISFDVTLYGTVTIYGCTYRTYKPKDSEEEKGIIDFPSKKGKDDKWYKHAYFFVTDEMLASIESQIEALI